jgi:hypothetical protein
VPLALASPFARSHGGHRIPERCSDRDILLRADSMGNAYCERARRLLRRLHRSSRYTRGRLPDSVQRATPTNIGAANTSTATSPSP